MISTHSSVSTFSHLGDRPQFDAENKPAQAVTYWLTRDIVRGVFPPGKRLKVAELSDFYKVGYSPVRDAIHAQAFYELVSHEHFRGYAVAPVSLTDYDEVLQAFQQIYKLAAKMALEQGGNDWEESLIVELHRSKKVVKVMPDADPELREYWQRAYWSFHYKILEGCGSKTLLNFFTQLANRLERYVSLYADMESDRTRENHAEHESLIKAIVDRDENEFMFQIDSYFSRSNTIRESIKQSLKQL
ncbi:FCD domain-containing protein [Pseudoalteromonas lipolytica]|uniref:FCD domain-containing protein n=1 Tax=Pseudoalteromonas lipolytica TaxID=570156 RepID=A0ABU8SZ36_9GAMM